MYLFCCVYVCACARTHVFTGTLQIKLRPQLRIIGSYRSVSAFYSPINFYTEAVTGASQGPSGAAAAVRMGV